MNIREIISQEQQIRSLFNPPDVFKYDTEMLSHWAKYLCVLTSGFIENAVRHYLSEFASQKSHPFVSNYVTDALNGFQNPNMERILTIIGAFSIDWRKQLEEYVEGERKDAINSIVANRHNIAHGKSVGLTFVRMKKFFDKAVEVVDFIKNKVAEQ
jgi:hypothetical protein